MKKTVIYFCLIYLLGSILFAQSFYVNNVTGIDANNGLSPIATGAPGVGPKKTISNAIIASSTGNIIYIAATGINYNEHPMVDKQLTFIGYSVSGAAAYVIIELTTGDMTFNVPGGTIMFLALPIAGSGYSYPAAAGFQFRGTATSGFYFQAGNVMQVNVNFSVLYPFQYR